MDLTRILGGMIVTGSAILTSAALPTDAMAAEDKIVIGLAMPFQNNGWQKGVLDSANWAVEELNKNGKNIELKVTDAASDAQTQIQQVNNLVLQGVDYIIIEPLSSTALNGAIDNAINAGIPVLSTVFGTVTNPRPIDMQYDNAFMAKSYVNYLADKIGGKGNALNIRGLAGAGSDRDLDIAYKEALKAYPDIKIVAEVYGDWNQSTAQQRIAALLPTLPKIDVIFSQGVAAYGASQAFLAAGMEVPPQVFGLDGIDLNMLRELNEKYGYDSVAVNHDPGVGSVAVNVAVAQLSGVEVPQKLVAPTPTITVEDIKTKYANIPDSETVAGRYSYDWTLENVIGVK